ncbi:MAG: DUF2332 domain-containing protein [Chloroflexi bacterium]|nr:DUF2332 domain-containing protein [Chloroflexota bacterium]
MQQELSKLARQFKAFARVESQAMSPFYSALSERIWQEDDVLAVASNVAPGQPPPNMLFAAVLFLLNRGANPDLLAKYPPNWSNDDSDATYAKFRGFLLDNSAEVIPILQSRRVQSNVVRRAAVLALGMHQVRNAVGDGPLVNIEIGCSLGLTLLWQRFHYDYGAGRSFGDSNSPVKVVTEMTGETLPVDFDRLPSVDRSIGIEFEPINPNDPDAIEWLEALIWRDHQDNLQLSRAAAKMLRAEPPEIYGGDAAIVLPEVIATLPPETSLCVYHSHTWNQMNQVTRDRIDQHLIGESMNRRVVRLSFEGAQEYSALQLIRYEHGKQLEPDRLANCEAHGRRIQYVMGGEA